MKFSKYLFKLALVILMCSSLFGQDLEPGVREALDSIQANEAYDYCRNLSSKEFVGRLTGHEGYTQAARWAAGQFKQWGLQPIDEKQGYLQAFPSPYTVVESAQMTLFLPQEKKGVILEVGRDFLPLLYSASGSRKAKLVFVGWGISAPELGYDDYAGVEVTGKFVLCFRGTPDPADKRYEGYDYHNIRMNTARSKGAVGLFYFYPEPTANPNGAWQKDFTPAVLSYRAADMILREKGVEAKGLQKELGHSKKPRSFPLHSEIEFKVTSRHFPEGVGYNIVGYIPGSDPLQKKECLVMGGHFDHCGLHAGLLFPGAHDNASGSAAVMELAEAFARLKRKPKRSMVFVLFGGEEMGLTGSNYFAAHLPQQCEKIDTMFNFDMVGQGQGTFCVLSQEPGQLKETLEQADRYVKTLKGTRFIRGVGPRSSDYAPFFRKGAACIAFFSTGPHLHYHRPEDTVDYINGDIMAAVARLAFLTAYDWADR